ncbi:MAG TPA: efflux RND transporter periplasmic adaptor subunit [Vicinamibacterales bacterium]|nr:efflux RND transporter periplasmic adaptor subunit [Vicinamibacterales bacterium]
MKGRLMYFVLALAAIAVSGALYYHSAAAGAAPQYVTAQVSRGDIVDAVEATGTLQAVTTVQVGTQVSGTIKALYADFNSVVKKGQVVAELEPSLFQTQVDQAQATVVRLQAEVARAQVDVQDTAVKLRRANELWGRQLIARTDLEAAEAAARQAQASEKSALAQVAQAQAALNQANVNLEHTTIRAPIDGVVISRAVDVGQTVAASMQAPTIFVIANDLSRMQVNARIDESDIGRIRPGQKVTFRVDAYPSDRFNGTVSQVRLEPVTEQNVVTYTTIIDVPNKDMKLKPGMTANVTVQVATAKDVLWVPTSALRFQPESDGTRVWLLTADGPTPVPVTAGLSDGATTAIVDGAIGEGATVITGMAQSSSDGGASSRSPLIPQRGRGRQGAAAQRGGGR